MRTCAHSRGFTLLEMMVTLALIGILAGLSIAALGSIKQRGTFVASSGDLLEAVRQTRSEAFSRGSPCVFVVDTTLKQWWVIDDVGGVFNIATFVAATPAPAPAILINSGTMASTVSFGPSTNPTGYGTALPAPFAGVPSYQGSSPAPAFGYCSFCSTNSGDVTGAITFYGSGGAAFSGGPNGTTGQQFTVNAPQPGGLGLQIMTIAVIGRTGAIASFETSR
jgi:type IV fimbrial biogenesis protein FimT